MGYEFPTLGHAWKFLRDHKIPYDKDSTPFDLARAVSRIVDERATLRAKLEEVEMSLRRIAGDEKGVGVHRPCCSRGQRIAREALKATTAEE